MSQILTYLRKKICRVTVLPLFNKCVFFLNYSLGQTSDAVRRGTLADLGRTFGGRNKRIMTSAVSIAGPPPLEPDFMSKIRKRRETSADITVLRKGSGAGTDLKSDISRCA